MPLCALAADKFLVFRRWLDPSWEGRIAEAGNEASFIADFFHPRAGSITAYCKLYPNPTGAARGLVNEITGYVIAYHYGLAQPEPAFLAEIPIKRLPLAGLLPQHQWIRTGARRDERFPAWCTTDARAPTPAHFYGLDAMEAIRRDIAKGQDVNRATTFDHIIANVDRNLRNLLRTGPSQYQIIDHGRIACDADWRAKDLVPGGAYRNRLLETVWDHKPPSRAAANAMVHAAEQWVPLGLPDEPLALWWSRLLNADDRAKFDNFIRTRAQFAAQQISKLHSVI